MNPGFWRGRRVFLTGHTGFKGTWLTQWLNFLGAEVTGYSLDEGDDVRDLSRLTAAMQHAKPELVIHLAAQALVRPSYEDPVRTFTTNVIGTVHALEAIRSVPSARVAVMATSDKSYANSGALHAFREEDPLGGNDPYSSSKACAELAINSYRASFFRGGGMRVVSVRAGNVIGGGDWARDRLVPDLVRAFRAGTPAAIRYPDATRPWQFVLDALHGYLLTAEHAWERSDLPDAFNFGPDPDDARSVGWLADTIAARWGDGASWHGPPGEHPHEEPTLALDSSRASQWLHWRPLLDVETVVAWTTDWYKSARGLTVPQIRKFMELIP
ncbi:MAG TPA: CDP-glucose 4,6-dehydratase [Thermoanaerobaculia bacterium]|nr:CDP-glucose 4,6-dehydratase [Thermoanaerobaculia bacterium]